MKNKITAEEIYLEFCESSHGTYPQLQEVWDELTEIYGVIEVGSPIKNLFRATINFTLQQVHEAMYENDSEA